MLRYHLSLKETLLFPPYRYNKRQRCFLFRKRKWLGNRKSKLAPRKLQWLQWDRSNSCWHWHYRHQQCKQCSQCESGGDYATATTTNHTNIPSKCKIKMSLISVKMKIIFWQGSYFVQNVVKSQIRHSKEESLIEEQIKVFVSQARALTGSHLALF